MTPNYTEEDIAHLRRDWDHIRAHPAMYVGSTGAAGVRAMVGYWLDEVARTDTTRLGIDLLADGGCRLSDDGRLLYENGGVEMFFALFCVPGAGWHGPSLTPVLVALSSRLIVEATSRDGGLWRQEFARGRATTPRVQHESATGAGTALTFWPDEQIFKGDRSFNAAALRERLWEAACVVRGLSVSLRDEASQAWSYGPDLTLRDLALTHAPGSAAAHAGVVRGVDEGTGFSAEVAIRWVRDTVPRVIGFVNGRRCDLGTHRRGLLDGVAWATEAARERPNIRRKACEAGLVAVVSVWMDAPQFESQARERLNSLEAVAAVSQATRAGVGAFFAENSSDRAAIVAHLRAAGRPDPKLGPLTIGGHVSE